MSGHECVHVKQKASKKWTRGGGDTSVHTFPCSLIVGKKWNKEKKKRIRKTNRFDVMRCVQPCCIRIARGCERKNSFVLTVRSTTRATVVSV